MYSVTTKESYNIYIKDIDAFISHDKPTNIADVDWHRSVDIRSVKNSLNIEYIEDETSIYDIKSVYIIGTQMEVSYPYDGEIQLIQLNTSIIPTDDIYFFIEKQSQEDYKNQINNWIQLSPELLFNKGISFAEFVINNNISKCDIIRINFTSNKNQADAIMVRIQIKNKVLL